ncbi:MAG: hypothetical protein II220_09395, partial [Spirochaetales bacterium]|nr:hypothetical protein [Spirochaetales bacterium]
MWLTDIFKIKNFKSNILTLQRENAALSSKLNSLEGENFFSIQGKVGELNNCYDQRLQESQTLSLQIRERFEKVQELDKQIITKQRNLSSFSGHNLSGKGFIHSHTSSTITAVWTPEHSGRRVSS